MLAGSRNRWVTPDSDNYGFARFVFDNEEMLRRLGPGRHFGEWWGAGIGRKYGLPYKRLSLFNVGRFKNGLPEGLPATVGLVPVLYRGAFDSEVIQATIDKLYNEGSVAAPGWMTPEGVIVTSLGATGASGAEAGFRWKVTDNGDVHKGVANAGE